MQVMSEFIPDAAFSMWEESPATAVSDTNGEVFEREVSPYLDALYRAAITLTMEAAHAEDLVREAIPKANRLWYQFPAAKHTLAWLLAILRHTFVNEYCSGRCAPAQVEMMEIDNFAVFEEVQGTDPATRFFVFGDVEGRRVSGIQVVLAA